MKMTLKKDNYFTKGTTWQWTVLNSMRQLFQIIADITDGRFTTSR